MRDLPPPPPIPDHACPRCGHRHDAYTSLGADDQVVEPGALALCIGCGALSVFDDGMRPRPLTAGEAFALMTSDRWPEIEVAQEALQALRAEREG
jgi:hypothetical protein